MVNGHIFEVCIQVCKYVLYIVLKFRQHFLLICNFMGNQANSINVKQSKGGCVSACECVYGGGVSVDKAGREGAQKGDKIKMSCWKISK